MKALFVVCVAAALAATDAKGGDDGKVSTATILRTCAPMRAYYALNVAKYQPACVISLRHEVEGVVECALRDAMLLKIARPEVDVPGIRAEIERLSIEGATPVVRYKAWLAMLVYQNPSLFAAEAGGDYWTAEEAFAAVAHRLERALLAARQ